VTRPVPFLDVAAMVREVRSEADAAWTALLDSGDFVRGHAVSRFEEEWADYCGTTHAIGVGNGTDALWLTLRALGLGPGDEVVIPTNTFVATVEAVVHTGADPVFADVEPDTLLMSSRTLAAAITPRTRAVVVVHLYGQMPDMDDLLDFAQRADVMVVEDAAQAHGARWRGARAGSFGVAGCFSFYPGKNLGAFGDAGAVVTSDDRLAATIRSLSDHGRIPGARNDHARIGFNSRMDTLQAAVLSAKLRRLDEWNRRRRSYVSLYRALLEGSEARMVTELEGGEPVYHLAVAEVPDRDGVISRLAAEGIGTGVHYPKPCHLIAPYANGRRVDLPVAEAAADRIVSLPLSPHMDMDDVVAVCDVLRSVVPVPETLHG
jgi:dTDP-4-amino-4,6-dideoxygalactose transaminase